ncbi:MAG: hypothetical protein ABR499_19665 [Gemmatimonadaceae bacterium]
MGLSSWSRLTSLVVTIAACCAPLARSGAQDPWPGAKCYALTRGPWRGVGGAVAPPVPDLIILDSARVDPLIWYRRDAARDTARRVAHGRVGDAGSHGLGYERDVTWWSRPRPDSIYVLFGTGYGGLELRFLAAGAGLSGSVSTFTDASGAPTWDAPVAGRPVRCPPAPPRIGRLRLAVAEVPGQHGPLPQISISLVTEAQFECVGYVIADDILVMGDTLAMSVYGVFRPPGSCPQGQGPATSSIGLRGTPRRSAVLVRSGQEVDRFVLTVTDSTLALTTERSSFVSADETVQRRTPWNLIALRCGPLPEAGPLCDDVEQWLARQPGVVRVDPVAAGIRPGQENSGVRSGVFRYATPAALRPIRACIASVAEQVRATSWVFLTLETWLGEELEAHSTRSDKDPNAPVPTRVTSAGACARSM